MSKRIPQHFIEEVVASTDIVSVIQSRVSLKKQGSNYVAACPFHDEKTPSFNVIPGKRFYYCFGCGAHGNAIGFLMQFDRMEFIDAVRDLASDLGLSIPTEEKQQDSTEQEDWELLKKVDLYYQHCLKTSKQAIDYLKSRGLSGVVAKHFHLGFAPNQWDNTLKHFNKEKAVLTRNGLVIQKDQGKCYDRFRNRIMFPIRNSTGHTIAFGGRTLGDDTPKYMNSPETALFHKSHELYGLYELLQKSRFPDNILLVEGYMDVIALHQHGIDNAVATLGTATNPKHLQKLLRYTKEIIFCFDGDKAGQTAAWRALIGNLSTMREGVQLRFMFLPENDDPDSLVRRVGQQGFMQRLAQAEPLSVVFFKLLKEELPLDTPDAKAGFAAKAMEYLNRIPKGLFKELMLAELAKQLNVYVSDLNTTRHSSSTNNPSLKHHTNALSPAQQAIALLLQEPKLCQQQATIQQLQGVTISGVSLLIELVELLQSTPTISVGEIIAHVDDEQKKQEIAMLAARRLPFTTEQMLAEFNDSIAFLKHHQQEQETKALITKSKQNMLSTDEKKRLYQLLTEKQGDRV